MVIIPGTAGMFGVLPGHVPTISELKPGLLEVTVAANDVQKFFISSGFAFAHDVGFPHSPCSPPPVRLRPGPHAAPLHPPDQACAHGAGARRDGTRGAGRAF